METSGFYPHLLKEDQKHAQAVANAIAFCMRHKTGRVTIPANMLTTLNLELLKRQQVINELLSDRYPCLPTGSNKI